MKKMLSCLLLTILFFAAVSVETQVNEPVYIHDIYPHFFVGPLVCEFALNGDIDIMRMVEPYVYNGRLYFLGLAFPTSTGNLRQTFEFNIDLYEDNPRIGAVYQGASRDLIVREHVENGIFAAGYALAGSIIITHVFFDMESANRWANTVRLASD